MQWEDVSRLIQLFKEHGLGELEFEDERFRLKLKTPQVGVAAPIMASAPVASAPAASTGPAPAARATDAGVEEKGRKVTSPFVGTFYRQPAPDAPPYAEVGQIVSKGQVLCIVEAMKLMNEIEAEVNGRVVKIYPDNGKPVEFGEPLFLIEPL